MKYIESPRKRVEEASKVFNISRKVIFDWKLLKKSTGVIKAKTGYQKGPDKKIKDIDEFKKFLEANCDKLSKELASLWLEKVSNMTIWPLVRRLGYTYKKSLSSSQKRRWIIDESGIEDHMLAFHMIGA